MIIGDPQRLDEKTLERIEQDILPFESVDEMISSRVFRLLDADEFSSDQAVHSERIG
jgi:hypothetical protein